MKVKELIKELEQYNPDAEMETIADNRKQRFSLTFGGGDGATKMNCESVSIYLDDMNSSERAG